MCRSKLQHKFATETKRNLQEIWKSEKLASLCGNKDFALTMVSKKKKRGFVYTPSYRVGMERKCFTTSLKR